MGEKQAVWAEDELPATGPLRGVKILDLTTVLMGPSATQMLGDLGADVVKVETLEGDIMRHIGPWRNPGMGPLYLWSNRNKRSLSMDLKTPEGKAAVISLAAQADVLVSNIRPQALNRLGLDYETLARANPKLIYCVCVGYGSGGPMAGQPVYDDLMQAASGLSGLFATIDGVPRYAPINICDRVVGLFTANAITAALYHRAMTGEGQEIEVPMFETMSQFVLGDHVGGGAFEPPEGRMGYKRLLTNARGPYATKDGSMAIVVYADRHWEAFLKLVGHSGLLQRDKRFADQESRTQHADEVGAFLAEQLRHRTTGEWLEALGRIDIPACTVNDISDLYENPHLKASGFFEKIEHPTEGMVRLPRHPVRYGKTPAQIRRHAPQLGQHNKDFLK
jgi:crotonobetainyl-CoA:carnitine CoA-transferase CaiB-like acyl-CoA transferase